MTFEVPCSSRAEWMARLAQTGGEEGRRRLLESHASFHDRTSAEELYAEALRLAYVEPVQASRVSQALEWLSEIVGDDYFRALSLRCTGHVHFLQNRHQSALEAYEGSRALFEALGLDLEAGRTLSSGLQVLIYLGKYDQAYQWAGGAEQIFLRHGDHVRAARLAGNVGNILYRQDRHAEALGEYHRAYQTLSREGGPRDVAGLLSNMAVCCTSLNRFSEALAYYHQAREHCDRHGLALLAAAADYNVAYLYYLRADYLRAFELYQATRAHCRAAGDAYHEALCDLDESEILLELNLNDQAGHAAGRAAKGFEALSMWYERGKSEVNRAIALSRAGDLVLGLKLLRRARKILAAEHNRLWPALIDLYQAILSQQQGRHADARRLCLRAYRVLSASQLPGKAGLCELVLSRLSLEAEHREEARTICLRALERFETSGGPSLRFHGHFLLGQIEEQSGDLPSARRAYQLAQSDVEDLRLRMGSDEMQISFLKDKLAVYEGLVSLCAGQGETEDAFRYIQQAKSRSLADAIALPPPAGTPQDEAAAACELQGARQDLNGLYRQIEQEALLAGNGSPKRLAAMRSQAREQESRLSRLMDRSPAHRGAQAVSLEEVLAVMPAGSALLEYYEVRGILHVCVLCRGRLQWIPLGPATGVQKLLGLLRFQMSKYRLGEAYLHHFAGTLERAAMAHLRDLYAELIAPLRRLLDAQHLVIAPHGFLHHLPFHALHDGTNYLIDDFTVSYAPSAAVYALCRRRPARFVRQSLVLGIPDARAPYVEAETVCAAELLPNARVFRGAAATETVLRQLGSSSRFIHIATHGLFRRDNPVFSSIRLGTSLLSLFDLYRLSLSAELVTLSGCGTGMNVVVGGDELLGLVRGLLFAGAHATLVSLWDVNDRSTTDFMEFFYRSLRADPDKAAAARSAMRATRDRYSHPYFWAPFVLVGQHAALPGAR